MNEMMGMMAKMIQAKKQNWHNNQQLVRGQSQPLLGLLDMHMLCFFYKIGLSDLQDWSVRLSPISQSL
jgi:hypothetical protein